MIYLDEWEELGIKIVVLLHTGMFGNTVGEFDLRAKVPTSLHDEFDYQITNPIEHIPNSIMVFIDEYFYYEKYPAAAPKYDDVNPKYWAAVKLYDSYKGQIMNNKSKEEAGPPKPKGIGPDAALNLYNKKR